MYPGACMPDRFRIVMNDIPAIEEYSLYDEYITPSTNPPTIVFEDGSTATGYSWTTTETFVDGIYWWWVIPYSGIHPGERSEMFRIEIYSETDSLSPTYYCLDWVSYPETNPEPVYPRNEQTIHSLSPRLIWRDRNPQLTRCMVPWRSAYLLLYSQDYEAIHAVNINDILDAQPDYVWDFDDGYWHLNQREFGLQLPTEWVLPEGIQAITAFEDRAVNISLEECRRTYWVVYLFWQYDYYDQGAGSMIGSEIYSFDIDPALCAGTSAPALPLPMTESATPRVRVTETANCRSGPTLEYPIMSTLPANSMYDIIGRNQTGDSWLILDPAITEPCWVYQDRVEVLGDTSQVAEVIPDPPPMGNTPTDTPETVDCSQYNGDWQTCTANPACSWDPNGSPASPCVNK